MKDFTEFEKQIGFEFKNKDLLTQAFLHRSYLNEHPDVDLDHNERIEFLGDAVLELVVTDYLYRKFPKRPEGDLTAYRASLVNTVSLADVAKELNFDNYLLLSKGEAKDMGKARSSILANTFESVIGAMYLDQGYSMSEKFIHTFLLPRLEGIIKEGSWRDAKSFVQEKAQETVGVTPSYKVVSEAGPDHEKVFTSAVYFGTQKIAEGSGQSKQEAETAAAREALKVKGWN